MSKPSERHCPFCGTTIDLAECRVVSTLTSVITARPALSGVGGHLGMGDITFDEDDAETAGGRSVRPAETAEPGGAGEVLFDPTANRQPTRSWTTALLAGPRFRSLSAFPQHLVPRRECRACGEHLPPEMEARRTHIFSVVGLNVAGKSNYLASALTLARQGGLADFGITEFTPGLDTANRFQTDFYIKLFREREVLAGTSLDLDVGRKPLAFKVTPSGGEPFLMMTHDVAGEALIDHRVRSLSAEFVRRSVGVIFLLDPLEFDPVRARVLPELVPPSRAIDQADLLDQVLQELSYRLRGDNVPLAIVVGKADLLTQAIAGAGSFHGERRTGDVVKADIATVNSEVKDLLVALGQRRIVELGERHGVTTFHAVSSLGGTERDVMMHGVRPRRVLDPLGVVLSRFAARAATG